MATRMTKREMFKEIFFDATEGKRSNANFVDGMTLIDCLPAKLEKDYLIMVYNQYINGERSSRRILSELSSTLRYYGTPMYKCFGEMIERVLVSTRH